METSLNNFEKLNHGMWNDFENLIHVVVSIMLKCQNWKMFSMQCGEDKYT
jgi:hypothetical protein